MAVNEALLDALLSPTTGGVDSPRAQAESHLQTIPVETRSASLLAVLQQSSTEAHWMMAAVLLRRDVATLAGNAMTQQTDKTTALQLLRGFVEPFVSMFINSSGLSSNSRRLVGHCLAEICASLSVLSEPDSDSAFETIISKAAPLLSTRCNARSFISFWTLVG